jgi:hypothetical protein
MESLTLFVKDKKQVDFLYQLLEHLDFVVLPTQNLSKLPAKKKHSIFDSAGMWEKRAICQEQLRAIAWKRT